MSRLDAPGPPRRPAAPLRLPLSRPRWTYVFMAINVAVWVLMAWAGRAESAETLLDFGASSAENIAQQGEVWRLFTANFVHIGLAHLGFNMVALYVLGREVEMLMGSARFVAIYLLSGLSGAIVQFALDAPDTIAAGASTSIFGLIGALLAMYFRNRRHFGGAGYQRFLNLILFALLSLLFGLSMPGIGNLGHIGGFLGGLMLGWLLCPYYSIETDGLQRRVVDLNSLRQEWIGVALFVALLVAAVLGGIARQR